ncbi:MAG TPA: helix-turn-helix domain-containing protein [Pirellulales bacterium]|jgi:excisionase family DNA binding protein|nr:helix-turn-helix domain-containing protein [Pirellulales bacterium]
MFRVEEVAKYFRVTRKTVLSWIESGRMTAVDVAPVGSRRRHFRIMPETIVAFESGPAKEPEATPATVAARLKGIKEYV